MTKLGGFMRTRIRGYRFWGGSTAQRGGASFQNRQLIGEVGTTTSQPRDIQLYENK